MNEITTKKNEIIEIMYTGMNDSERESLLKLNDKDKKFDFVKKIFKRHYIVTRDKNSKFNEISLNTVGALLGRSNDDMKVRTGLKVFGHGKATEVTNKIWKDFFNFVQSYHNSNTGINQLKTLPKEGEPLLENDSSSVTTASSNSSVQGAPTVQVIIDQKKNQTNISDTTSNKQETKEANTAPVSENKQLSPEEQDRINFRSTILLMAENIKYINNLIDRNTEIPNIKNELNKLTELTKTGNELFLKFSKERNKNDELKSLCKTFLELIDLRLKLSEIVLSLELSVSGEVSQEFEIKETEKTDLDHSSGQGNSDASLLKDLRVPNPECKHPVLLPGSDQGQKTTKPEIKTNSNENPQMSSFTVLNVKQNGNGLNIVRDNIIGETITSYSSTKTTIPGSNNSGNSVSNNSTQAKKDEILKKIANNKDHASATKKHNYQFNGINISTNSATGLTIVSRNNLITINSSNSTSPYADFTAPNQATNNSVDSKTNNRDGSLEVAQTTNPKSPTSNDSNEPKISTEMPAGVSSDDHSSLTPPTVVVPDTKTVDDDEDITDLHQIYKNIIKSTKEVFNQQLKLNKAFKKETEIRKDNTSNYYKEGGELLGLGKNSTIINKKIEVSNNSIKGLEKDEEELVKEYKEKINKIKMIAQKHPNPEKLSLPVLFALSSGNIPDDV